MRRFALTPALIAALVAAVVADAGPSRASEILDIRAVSRPRLVVDYLPALVYENELVPVRLRVVNAGASPAECTVELALHAGKDEKDPAESPAPLTVTVEAGEDAPVSFDVPSRGWATASVEFSFERGETESFRIAHFGQDEKIPPLAARGERLYVTDTGDVAVLSLAQRTSQPDRQWYLWKRLAERLGEGVLPVRVLVLGARLCEPRERAKADGLGTTAEAATVREGGTSGHQDDAAARPPAELPAYLAEVCREASVPVVATVLPGEGDRRAFAPVLADLAAALRAFEKQRPAELVVWVVACDDARRATPLWTFRKAADLVLSRARSWGAGRLAVLFVPEPAVPAERRALYAEQLRLAAKAYRGSFTRLDELGRARSWAVEGASGPQEALGRWPNARGHEALARAVLEKIRP